ncbi:MAG: hypothetical protein Q9M27_03060 [Mariprofundaceae bacterium]|nr:hypothetical protein [Mariprofundaceae bacterium]
MLTLIAAGIGIIGMFRLVHKFRLTLLILVLFAPSLTRAEVSIMKPAPARGLIRADGSQPVSLSTAQWVTALGNIWYANDRFLASGSPKPVFSAQQIHTLAPQIWQLFANIGTDQAVVFHQDKIRGNIFFSRSRLYWYFSRIENDPAFKLTDIAEEDARISHVVEAVSEDEIDTAYWRLIPQKGQALHRGRPDFLAMPVSTLTPDTTRTAFLPVAKQPARIQSHSAAIADDHDTASRISTLHRLLGKSLITRDEYRRKLETIISEYETQHPSPEAGLEFLQMLNKKNLLPSGILQEQRQQLLDRL